ncbi:alcohol dehydrogenase catalytic domain-containing protein [Herbiconiux daphne]|uniref:Alcohol dehydrogenase catalytic domain-containing protein n=1 Tax=Herbiconiux daphne TaxID=2970914 RepID=A0ABT2H746_9MICO|nr:alcohol dehydrogenase catalytic domain-containing protein [Herbiconiux daphne]MCS5735738.1 alcohol dehydrogenase catalytic domain-containing protein [Herbiconiux daphne]
MSKTMLAARMYNVAEEMRVEEVPIPTPGFGDVRVRVHAVNIVPNLSNILSMWTTWFPGDPLPTLPATFGLDPAGEIEAVGEGVIGWSVGDRVYVNPGRYCLNCNACRHGDMVNCSSYAFAGYFGFSPSSVQLLDRYQGGLSEYMVAPSYSLVKLPDNLDYNSAARFGYLGTMYSALKKANAAPGKSLLVNGINGTLGLGAALLAPAMGLTEVYGTGRNPAALSAVEALLPGRIKVHSLADGPVDEWVHSVAGGGVDIYVDALGPGADHETFREGMRSLKRGGRCVNIGAMMGDLVIDIHDMMDQQKAIIGSLWSTPGESQELADMVAAGTLDLSPLEHSVYPLSAVNQAISGVASRNAGFSNYIISPSGE